MSRSIEGKGSIDPPHTCCWDEYHPISAVDEWIDRIGFGFSIQQPASRWIMADRLKFDQSWAVYTESKQQRWQQQAVVVVVMVGWGEQARRRQQQAATTRINR